MPARRSIIDDMDYTPLFIKAAHFILAREGGYSNDPDDRGGQTRYGIASKYHDVDLSTLTIERTLEIYHADYWQHCRCDTLPAQISVALFDGAVNHGPRAAIQMLQAPLGLRVDGIIGPVSARAIQQADQAWLINTYLVNRCEFYTDITVADSSQVKFLRGWYSRLFYVQEFISREVANER